MTTVTAPMQRKAAAPAEQAIESAAIHLSACRYRRQGLVCSTCCELAERAGYLAEYVEDGLEPDPIEQLVTIGREGWWTRLDDDAELIAA